MKDWMSIEPEGDPREVGVDQSAVDGVDGQSSAGETVLDMHRAAAVDPADLQPGAVAAIERAESGVDPVHGEYLEYEDLGPADVEGLTSASISPHVDQPPFSVDPQEQRTVRYPGNREIAEKHGVDVLPDVDPSGAWVEDPREKDEPWRSRFCLTQCTGDDDGVRCTERVRGSDRCQKHKRWCKGKTRKGTDCEAPPLKDFDYCINHRDQAEPGAFEAWEASHNTVDAPAGQSPEHGSAAWHTSRWGSPEQAAEAGKLGGQARRYPRLTEEIQRQIEEQAGEIVGAGVDAIHATKPVVVEVQERDDDGRSIMHQEVVEFPDHFVRLKAHEALTNRAFGRPHQAVDVSGETRQLNLNIDATDPEVRESLHAFLRHRPNVDA